jgi:hypothetical protein
MGRIQQNTNRYYRRVQVRNLMWVSLTVNPPQMGRIFLCL